MKKLLLLSTLLLTSCQPVSKLTTLLDVVTTSAEVVIAATGQLTPEQSKIVHDYISATASAVKLTAAEMQSADTTLQKVSKIAEAWQAVFIMQGSLQRLPLNVQNLIKIVTEASRAVLQEIQAELGKPPAINASKANPVNLHLSYSDKRKLSGISKRAEALIKK